MPLTAGAQTSMLTWALSNGTPTRPTMWYASLHSGNPGNTGASELSGSGYTRVSLGTSGLTVSGNSASNASATTFGPATATWTAATYAGLFDASTSGNFWGYTQLQQYGTTYGLAGAGVAASGSGYVSGDVGKTVTLAGGTASVTITAISGGTVTGIEVSAAGSYAASAIPSNPMTTQTGVTTGTGLTVFGIWSAPTQSFTLNNGDSITFSIGQLDFLLGVQPTFSPN